MTRRAEVAFAAAAALLSFVGAVVFLRLWRGDLGVPLDYFGDVNLQHFLVKSVIDKGWFYENDFVGAPHGLELYDYPVFSGETLAVVFFWLLGLLGASSAVALNVFYVLTYPAAGAIAYLVLRRLGAQPGPSLVCAVLFALAPYHFIRGETHLFLAAYYAVPVGAYLAIAVLSGDNLLGGRRQAAITAGLAAFVTVASGSFYYAAFTALLVIAAGVLRFVGARERQALLEAGFVVATIVVVALVQLSPTIAYQAVHGGNDEVAKRASFESEFYSLKLTELVLPLDEHRIDVLGRLKRRYSAKFPPADAKAATLGIVATAGFAWLLAVVFAGIVGRRPRGRHPALAGMALTAFLLGTVGGGGTLLGVLWPQIRAWNRLSIFIAFFSLAAVALGLGALGRRLPRPAYMAVLVGVLAVGLFDQTTNAFIPDYPTVKAQWRHDDGFIRSLESELPPRAMIVQLPYETFPEPPSGRQAIYEPAKPYLHSHDLRWSWGAMRGRPGDWAAENAVKPAAELVPAARAAGFAGILVDRIGYPDDGGAIEADLVKVLGKAPQRSPSTRFLFWRF